MDKLTSFSIFLIAASSTSLYDNVTNSCQTPNTSAQALDNIQRPIKSETGTMTSTEPHSASVNVQNHVGLQSQDDVTEILQLQETSKSEGTQAGGTLQQSCASKSTASIGTEMHHNIINNNSRRSKSKSIEDINIFSDNLTQKRILKSMPSTESPVTSPEMTRRRYNYYNTGPSHSHQHNSHILNNNTFSRPASQSSRFSGSR